MFSPTEAELAVVVTTSVLMPRLGCPELVGKAVELLTVSL